LDKAEDEKNEKVMERKGVKKGDRDQENEKKRKTKTQTAKRG
jgi:hypothetical protein